MFTVHFSGRIGYSVICRYILSQTHTYVNVDRSYCRLFDVCNKQTDHLFRSELTLYLLIQILFALILGKGQP